MKAKANKIPTQQQPDPSKTASAPLPPRPPKGHRQRGAGTVIVAKPPVVTADGITLRPHERLPTHLLLEYCQQKQRPKPKYFSHSPHHRFSVLLEDSKNRAGDLNFLPAQSFESDHLARDYAALLALFSLQKALPLENKLPEPFSTSWRQMLEAEKNEKKSGGPVGKDKFKCKDNVASVSPSIPTSSCIADAIAPFNESVMKLAAPLSSFTSSASSSNASNQKASSGTQDRQPADVTADWICDSCGSQNFGLLLSGEVRSKCFRCQNNRSADCASLTQSVVALSQIVKVKAPTPVMDLRQDAKFAARTGMAGLGREDPAARVERLQASRRKRAYFDALRRANKPSYVFLGAELKQRLEAALQLTVRDDAVRTAVEHTRLPDLFEAAARGKVGSWLVRIAADENDTVGGQTLSPADQWLIVSERSAPALLKQGFMELQVCAALQNVHQSGSVSELLSEICMSGSREEIASAFGEAVTEAALEHMCLHAEECELPEGLDGRAFEQRPGLQVFKQQKTLPVATGLMKEGQRRDGSSVSALVERAAVMVMRYGWPYDVSVNALKVVEGLSVREQLQTDYNQCHTNSDSESDSNNMRVLRALVLLHLLAEATACEREGLVDEFENALLDKLFTDEGGGSERLADAIQEEIESLEAIFGSESFAVSREGQFTVVSVRLRVVELAEPVQSALLQGGVEVEGLEVLLVLHPLLPYSARTPVGLCRIVSVNTAVLSSVPEPDMRWLLNLQSRWWDHMRRTHVAGEPALYSAVCWLRDAGGAEFTPNDSTGQLVSLVLSKAIVAGKNVNAMTTRINLEIIKASFVEVISQMTLTPTAEMIQVADGREAVNDWTRDGWECWNEDVATVAVLTDQVTVPISDGSHGRVGRHRGQQPQIPYRKASFWDSPAISLDGEGRGTEQIKSLMMEARRKLPAFASREEFLALMRGNHRGVVVTGETGCGKTTQIPQFLLEEFPGCKVVVCQPRRLAAVGVATRVAEECCCPVGRLVGYMVKGDSQSSAETRLLFCTYGVLLRRLQDDPSLTAVDYVILDEVHERGIDSDFALALLVTALGDSNCKLKLILMSATISTEKFASYLGRATAKAHGGRPVAGSYTPQIESRQGEWRSEEQQAQEREERRRLHGDIAPVMFIPGYTYPVTEYFKQQYEEIVRTHMGTILRGAAMDDHDDDNDGATVSRGVQASRRGEVDYGLICQLVLGLTLGLDQSGANATMLAPATGCVLVFMPGVAEIARLTRLLQEQWSIVGKNHSVQSSKLNLRLRILPLHGALSPNEQSAVFKPASPNELKVVVSTNVAEASVTLPDVTVVIDCCRVKEMGFDPERGVSALVTQFASQDSLRQRKGRAGRVQSGRCFRLITLNTFNKLEPHSVPEILRAPLENIVLQTKAMGSAVGEGGCRKLLSTCVDPPSSSSIASAESLLMRLQALDSQKNLTPLGRHLASLPCDPSCGRLLIYGYLLGCLGPASCVAASVAVRSPYLSSPDAETRAKVVASKKRLTEQAFGKIVKTGIRRNSSDYVAVVLAVKEFSRCNGREAQRRFATENGLSTERLLEILKEQRELLQSMVHAGLLSTTAQGLREDSIENRNCESLGVVVSALVAGLYPRLAKIVRPPQRYVETAGGAVERDIEANEYKFYVPLPAGENVSTDTEALGSDDKNRTDIADEIISAEGFQRVFVHPSSINFGNNSFSRSSYLLYGEMQRTAGNIKVLDNAKIYLRETTEPPVYALLLFGGQLEISYTDQTLTIDGWIRFSAPGRIAALVQALRREFDNLMDKKIAEPNFDLSGSEALRLTIQLLTTDGIDK